MKYWRRPRNTTIAAIVVFLVSFGFWLNQPQPERVFYPSPDISWVIVTTTTTEPVPETTMPPETTVPVETVPPETVPVDTLPPEDSAVTTIVETTVP